MNMEGHLKTKFAPNFKRCEPGNPAGADIL